MLKAIASSFLAIIFLAVNLQLSVGKHFCGGRMVKSQILFGSSDMSCGMASEETECEQKVNYDYASLVEMDCCQNEFLSIQIEEEYNKTVKIDNSNLISFDFFYQTDIIKNPQSELILRFKSNRAPPSVAKDILILHQTFLI